MSDVTKILSQIEQGDPSAAEELLPLVYAELRKLAAARMAAERSDHTLQATALVHEAYLRLVDDNQAKHWDSRGHFFAAAAEAMRRILVDAARRKQAVKRGGEFRRVELEEADLTFTPPDEDLLAIDEALEQLEAVDAQAAGLAKLRFFAGMTVEEAAESMGIPPRSGYRNWEYARAWIYRRIHDADLSKSGEVN